MSKGKIINSILFLLVVGMLMPIRATYLASEIEKHEPSAVGFQYENILPDNQLKKGDYFDLLVKPGQKQKLETELSNDTNEKLTVLVSISNATTNGEGVIEYGKNKLDHTKDFTYKLTDMLKGPEEITLKPYETKRISYQLEVPDKNIAGMVLGGIELQKKEASKEPSDGVSVRSEFVYTFSVSLQMSQKKIQPQFSFNDVAYVEKMNKQLLTTSINNNQPMIIKGMQVDTIVTSQDSSQVLSNFSFKEVKMAPLSVMDIPLELEDYAPGKYRVKTIISYEEQVWELEQAFEIAEENKKSAENNAEPIRKNKSKNTWLLVASILIASVVIVYLVIRR